MANQSTVDRSPSSETPLFELVHVDGKGKGLVASQGIKRGTCIIEESALVRLPPDRSEHELGNRMVLAAEIRRLTAQESDLIDQLYHDPEKVSLLGSLLNASSSLLATRVATFHANSVAMGETGQHGTGLFPLFSRLNHSCIANVHHSFNATTGKETVYAVRQINKGEEIVTSYVPTAWRTKQQRADQLRQGWGFSCTCKACVGPKAAKSEERRSRMFEIDQALAMFEKGFCLPGLGIPATARQALGLSQEMLKLIREEGITDFQLAQVYRECGKYSLKLGDIDQAVAYAKKERDLERYCIGAETAHLKDDMKGAEYWLAHLLAEQGKKRASLPKKGMAGPGKA